MNTFLCIVLIVTIVILFAVFYGKIATEYGGKPGIKEILITLIFLITPILYGHIVLHTITVAAAIILSIYVYVKNNIIDKVPTATVLLAIQSIALWPLMVSAINMSVVALIIGEIILLATVVYMAIKTVKNCTGKRPTAAKILRNNSTRGAAGIGYYIAITIFDIVWAIAIIFAYIYKIKYHTL